MRRKKIRMLTVRLTTLEDDALGKMARAVGCTPSEYVRGLLRDAMFDHASQAVPVSPSREAAQ